MHLVSLLLHSAEELAELRSNLAAEEKAVSFVKPTRGQLTRVDLTPGSSTRFWEYTIRLPGGASETVRLPTSTDTGASYTLVWKESKQARKARKAAEKEAAAAGGEMAQPDAGQSN